VIHILYLAAGSGKRFGKNKLLAFLNGKPLFAWGLDTLCQTVRGRSDCRLAVVSRYEPVLDAAKAAGVLAVNSPMSEQGISYSIRAGLEAIGPLSEEDFLLFVLSDQPWLTRRSIEQMLVAAKPGTLCASAFFNGTPASPTLFSAKLAPELLALEGDKGGRFVLNRHKDKTVPVELCSAGELWDVDTPSDLATVQSRWHFS